MHATVSCRLTCVANLIWCRQTPRHTGLQVVLHCSCGKALWWPKQFSSCSSEILREKHRALLLLTARIIMNTKFSTWTFPLLPLLSYITCRQNCQIRCPASTPSPTVMQHVLLLRRPLNSTSTSGIFRLHVPVAVQLLPGELHHTPGPPSSWSSSVSRYPRPCRSHCGRSSSS
jgi:hypothetical protein